MPLFSKRDHFDHLRKDVNHNPKPFEVTDDAPTHVKQEYVAQEMKLWMMIDSIMDGKLPTNDQLLQLIDTVTAQNFLGSRRQQLSDDGVKLVSDFSSLLKTLKKVLAEKNSDELLQQFIYHTQLASSLAATRLKGVSGRHAASKAVKAAEHTSELLQKLKTVFRLVITNSSFRELLFDLNELGQDIISHMAGKEAQLLSQRNSKGAKSHDHHYEVESVDYSTASKNTPLNLLTDGRNRTHSETEQISYNKPVSRSSTATSHRERAPASFMAGNNDAVDEDAIQEESATQVEGSKNKQADEAEYGKSLVASSEKVDESHSEPVRDLMVAGEKQIDTIKEMLPSPVRKHVDNLHEAISEGLPEEKREALRRRIRQFIQDISQNSAFQSALQDMLSVFFSLSNQAGGLGAKANVLASDANIDVAREELKTLLERFAGDHSIDYLLEAGRGLKKAVFENYEMRTYIDDLGQFIQRSMLDPTFIDHADYSRRLDQLLHRGSYLFQTYCKDELQHLMQEVNSFFQAMRHDQLTQELGRELKQIGQHLIVDERKSRIAVKPHLIRDFATVAIPVAFERMKYIPIPRIEHEDENFRIVVEDVVLSSGNFLPNLMEIKLKNSIVLGLRRELSSSSGHSMTLNFHQIQCNIRDVPFYFKKKSGFPKVSDCGVANVLIGGNGVSLKIKLDLDQYSSKRTIIPRMVRCNVENLVVNIEHSQRDTFYRMFNSALTGLLKRQIEKNVTGYIQELLEKVDEFVTKLKNAVVDNSQYLEAGKSTSVQSTFNKYLGLSQPRSQRKGLVSSLVSTGKANFSVETLHDPNDEVDDVTRELIQAPWYSDAFNLSTSY